MIEMFWKHEKPPESLQRGQVFVAESYVIKTPSSLREVGL